MATQPDYQDALNINDGKIVVDGEQWGSVTGLTVDGRRPEDFINVIGGQLRRRRPEETEWSVDSAVMYDNIAGLKALKNKLFDIVIIVTNPNDDAPNDNISQTLTVRGCRISDENISLSDGSTFRMSGKAKEWTIEPGH